MILNLGFHFQYDTIPGKLSLGYAGDKMQPMSEGGRRVMAESALLGGRIRLYRQMRGRTQIEVARAISITYAELTAFERGRARICAAMLNRIALFLEVPIQAFYADLPATLPPSRMRRP